MSEQPINETEQVESMDIVPEEVPLSEEDQAAQDTMRDMDELVKIKEQLVEDNTQYELHVEFIELAKKLGFKEELEAARLEMHDVYPLTEALWLDWIQDTKEEDSEEGQIKLLQLYDKAQEDYFSVAIWKDYVEYKLEKFNEIFTDDITDLDETTEELIDTYREDILKAVRAASAHVKQSQEVWKLYSEFELNILGRFKTEDQLARVKKMYLDRLAVLHIDCEDTFNAYSSFISNYENFSYEESMVHANKIYAKTKVAAEDRDYYELQLTSTGYALDSFYKYIEHEKTTKLMFSLNHVRALYERAILIYCTDPGLWNDYILFLIEKARVQTFLESTCLRSIRNCPWSGMLWSHLARIMESGDKEDEQIEDVLNRALSSKAVQSNVDELVQVLLAKCDFKRRKVDWEDMDEEAVLDLRVTFEECLEYINEAFPKRGDPYYRIEKYYAYISLKRLGDEEKTREIWEGVVQKNGRSTEAWVQYMLFERDQGNYQKCSSLFKQAIVKNTDNPTRLIDVWTTVEHEIGTLKSYEEALIKINTKNKILSKQWANYAEQQQVEEEKTEEKKIIEKKKKSAHRIAQKQRAKEKKHKETESTQAEESQTVKPTAQETKAKEPKTAKPKLEETTTTADAQTEKATVTKEPKAEITEEPQVDDDGFKKPFLPSRSNNEGTSLKRKLSTGSDEKEEVKKPKTSTSFRPRVVRGKKALKLGQRAVSRNNAPSTETSTATTETTEDKPKSNDDFRAMLLGKK